MTQQELTYWYSYDSIPGSMIKRDKKAKLFADYYRSHSSDSSHEVGERVTLVDFYEDEDYLKANLSETEFYAIVEAKQQLPNNSFVVEDIISQGYDLTPLDSKDYPSSLKKNLGTRCPLILYSKGNKDLYRIEGSAIVGSRKATQVSLDFADSIAKKIASEGKVVISGDAKGVDQTGQLAALQSGGYCIIVLPQGITTFNSGFKKYYDYLVNGHLLVISTFPPKATWNTGYAMERNAYIYGLANEIYVAESDSKGGTWEGATNGLRKGNRIYVRIPGDKEKNANMKLIELGAKGVDFSGNIVETEPPKQEKTQDTDDDQEITLFSQYNYDQLAK